MCSLTKTSTTNPNPVLFLLSHALSRSTLVRRAAPTHTSLAPLQAQEAAKKQAAEDAAAAAKMHEARGKELCPPSGACPMGCKKEISTVLALADMAGTLAYPEYLGFIADQKGRKSEVLTDSFKAVLTKNEDTKEERDMARQTGVAISYAKVQPAVGSLAVTVAASYQGTNTGDDGHRLALIESRMNGWAQDTTAVFNALKLVQVDCGVCIARLTLNLTCSKSGIKCDRLKEFIMDTGAKLRTKSYISVVSTSPVSVVLNRGNDLCAATGSTGGSGATNAGSDKKKKIPMKPKLTAAAITLAKSKGKALAKKLKDALAAAKTETAATKEKNELEKKVRKAAWTKKKKRLFRGIMKLLGIDLSGTDAASKTKRDNFETAVQADLELTDADEVVFTYTKVTTRRRLLAVSTEASYTITVADDTAAAVEAALTADPDGTSIVATAAALDTSFAAVTAEVSAPEAEGELLCAGVRVYRRRDLPYQSVSRRVYLR
jgi:hypothetical protein